MALSDKDKHRVIFYLGWSGLTIVAGSSQFNSVVNARLTGLNTQIENLARGILERLDKLDITLEAAQSRLLASSVDGIDLNPDEIMKLKSERKRLTRELSDHLDISIQKSGGINVGVVS